MRVLALTHAHLHPEGLSPVSCERADSLVGTWSNELGWEVDVVYTHGSQWGGIWPDGKGLNVNIIDQRAPDNLMMSRKSELFSTQVKALVAKKEFARLLPLALSQIAKRTRKLLSDNGLAIPYQFVKAKKWGAALAHIPSIKQAKYDFIFACVGNGDEYLLQTALTLSENLGLPMVVDFRDLWSDHHDPKRFTDKQRKIIRRLEQRLLKNTVLLSVPQKPMVKRLEETTKIPVHLTTHGAHVEPEWSDGHVVSDEFRLLYAGKLYPGGPGLIMLLELLQAISREKTEKPVRCHFYVDDVAALSKLVEERNITSHVVIHSWVSPAAIWEQMRSAHLLITYDSGLSMSMPLLMTKAYQYAHSGRPILALYKYDNSSYDEFFKQYNAGKIFYDVQDAATWVKMISASENQYKLMPTFGRVPMREQVAAEFGLRIKDILHNKI
jgi:hypothetical protein